MKVTQAVERLRWFELVRWRHGRNITLQREEDVENKKTFKKIYILRD